MNVCPKHAISMVLINGFYRPIINNNCIQCNKCIDYCPILSNSTCGDANAVFEFQDKDCYSVQTLYRDYCSSGGVFGSIANHFIEKGGYVIGAAFDDSLTLIEQIACSNEELCKLYKSKYIQSYVGDIYLTIEQLLNDGKHILFCGTPCQVAGLKSFFRNNVHLNNLYSIDLICHGVASPFVFKKYLLEEKKGCVTNIDFRDKTRGWGKPGTIRTMYGDGTSKVESSKNDTFMRCYHSSLGLLPSCYHCKFSNSKRNGDLTIGDHWGIEEYKNDKKGTSVVIVNSSKGHFLFDILRKDAVVEKVDYSGIVKKQPNLSRSTKEPKLNVVFNEQLYDEKIKKSLYSRLLECIGINRDVGIVVLVTPNYGNNLTNWSLFNTVKELGYNPIFVTNAKREPDVMFRKKLFTKDDVYSLDINKASSYLKILILGSDQTLVPHHIGTDFFTLMPWAKSTSYIISYGSSFGHDTFKTNDDYREMVRFYLDRFDAISLREESGISLLKETFSLNGIKVLDPIFLTDYQKYVSLSNNKRNRIPQQPFIGVYLMIDSEENIRDILEVKRKTNVSYIICVQNNGKKTLNEDSITVLEKASVEELLYLINNSTLFLTDSFHGACLAVILKKQFILLNDAKKGGPTRIESLLNTFNLTKRRIDDYKTNNSGVIDYELLDKKLNSLIEESRQWLSDQLVLGSRSKKILSDYDVYRQSLIELNMSMQHRISLLETIVHCDINDMSNQDILIGKESACHILESLVKSPADEFQKIVNVCSQILDSGIMQITELLDYVLSLQYEKSNEIVNLLHRLYGVR